MNTFENKVFTHFDLDAEGRGAKEKKARDVASSAGYPIRRFRELREAISRLSFGNPRFTLFYRGQKKDYLGRATTKHVPRSALYPSLFRHPSGSKRLTDSERRTRLEQLSSYVTALRAAYTREEFVGSTLVKGHLQIAWALLQHYEKVPTPLVDLTTSPLVAASFATLDSKENDGYLYCFAIPHQTSSISFHIEDRICSVKLSAICPPEAKRAHIQDAYFVGTYPHRKDRSSAHNMSQRMIAKFKIPNSDKFWDDTYRPMRSSDLYPQDDKMKAFIDGLKPGKARAQDVEDDEDW